MSTTQTALFVGLVLGIAAAFGAVIFAAALGFFVLTRQPASRAVAPAA